MIDSIDNKIYSLDELLVVSSRWKLDAKQIVFTNGVFDILHPGHVDYLAKAAKLGNKLVIGLNSDNSVKRLGKGESRPYNSQKARAYVLAALASVDAVVVFDEDIPLSLINAIKPSVLVKGGDYNEKQSNKAAKDYIVGWEEVQSWGGQVKSLNFLEGYSTTNLIHKIQKSG